MLTATAAFFELPLSAQAADEPLLVARTQLREVFAQRGDLQQLFDATSWLPTDGTRTAGIRDLEDWAIQYGHKEHSELWWYGTAAGRGQVAALNGADAPSSPRALEIVSGALVPQRVSGDAFDFSSISAEAVYVVDEASRRALLALNSDQPRADAASAKLMTAVVAMEQGINLDQQIKLLSEDESGGVRLEIPVGTTMTAREFMYGMLTGEANNAAQAVARSTSFNDDAFTGEMNKTARAWGLAASNFADPTGVEPGTVTTASEAAAILLEALAHDEIRRQTTTGSKWLSGGVTVKSRNELLTDPNNGLYVYGGKIGFLRASGWHMSIKVMDMKKEKPLVIAVSGSDSLDDLFSDVQALGEWVWQTHAWQSARTDMTLQEARRVLRGVYDDRGDLQALFNSSNWLPVRAEQTSGIVDLEDWAAKYGYREHDELWWYATEAARLAIAEDEANQPQVVASSPRALQERSATYHPVNATGASFSMNSVTAQSVFVVDIPSRQVIVSENADNFHVLASLTKLMTGIVALNEGPSMSTAVSMMEDDEIGGARLRVPVGTTLSLQQMMYAMLVGSANNSANAIARATSGDVDRFVDRMNSWADEFGLKNTTFADPSGLDVDNVSTAREIAALALEAWNYYDLRKMCSTVKYTLYADGVEHTIKNTNQLLTDADNGLIVLGGKTGYLHESRWNLAVKMMDARNKPILVVVLGADAAVNVFRDAHTVADWVWDNYRWQ